MMQKTKPDLSSLAKKWPSSFVSRDKVAEFSGGILHPGTLANLDSMGIGPKRVKIGRKVAYKATNLVDWLATRAQKFEERGR